jgi:hypothetical protein
MIFADFRCLRGKSSVDFNVPAGADVDRRRAVELSSGWHGAGQRGRDWFEKLDATKLGASNNSGTRAKCRSGDAG